MIAIETLFKTGTTILRYCLTSSNKQKNYIDSTLEGFDIVEFASLYKKFGFSRGEKVRVTVEVSHRMGKWVSSSGNGHLMRPILVSLVILTNGIRTRMWLHLLEMAFLKFSYVILLKGENNLVISS